MTRRPRAAAVPPLDATAPAALRTVPQQPRAAATVRRILRAALTVLRDSPDAHRDSIAVEDIARAANTSVPAVYRYFASVDAIYTALVQQEQRRILQQGLDILAERTLRSEADLAANVVDFFLAVYGDLLASVPRMRFVIRRYHEVSYDGFDDFAPRLRAILVASTASDGGPAVSEDQIVAALAGVTSAIKALVLRGGGQLTDPAFRERLIRMALGILGQRDAVVTQTEPIVWTYDWQAGEAGAQN